MSLALIVELAGKSMLPALLTLAVLQLLHGRSPAERCRVAHAGLTATLILPIALIVLPRIELEAPRTLVEIMPPISQDAIQSILPLPAGGATAAPHFMDSAGVWLGWLYALPALMLLAAMIQALVRLRTLRRRARPVVDPRLRLALARAERLIGLNSGTTLLVSDELGSPISWGIARPTILLDERTVSRVTGADAVIAHELAHLRNGDWTKLLLGRVATAFFWFNPFVWTLARCCHELREEAADDAVLAGDVSNEDYAELLVAAARQEKRRAVMAHAVAPGSISLARRVARLVDPTENRALPGMGWTLACRTVAFAAIAPLAAISLALPQATVVSGGTIASTTLTFSRSPEPKTVPSEAKRSGELRRGGASLGRPDEATLSVTTNPTPPADSHSLSLPLDRRAVARAELDSSNQWPGRYKRTMRESAGGMERGAAGMERSAREMLAEAAALRLASVRRLRIAEWARRGQAITDRELLDAIPGMEESARGMIEGATNMRRQAAEWRRSEATELN